MDSKEIALTAEFCERTGLGMTIWKYVAGDEAALQAVRKAAREQSSRANVFIPVFPKEATSK